MIPLLASGVPPLPPPDRNLAISAILLIFALSFLAGFAIGMAVENTNLRLRERRLARGRQRLAARSRGLHRQLQLLHRLRDGAPDGDDLCTSPTSDHDDQVP